MGGSFEHLESRMLLSVVESGVVTPSTNWFASVNQGNGSVAAMVGPVGITGAGSGGFGTSNSSLSVADVLSTIEKQTQPTLLTPGSGQAVASAAGTVLGTAVAGSSLAGPLGTVSSDWTRLGDLIRSLNQLAASSANGASDGPVVNSASQGQPSLLVLPIRPWTVTGIDSQDSQEAADGADSGPEMAVTSSMEADQDGGGELTQASPSWGGGGRTITVSALGNQQVYGSLNSNDGGTTESIVIPITASNSNLVLLLRQPGGKPMAEMPVLEGMQLTDAQGRPIGRLGLPWSSVSRGPVEDAMINVQQAPAGSDLVVQVGAADLGSAGASGVSAESTSTSGGNSVAGWAMPFVMDVVRQNSTIAGVITSLVSSGPWSIAVLTSTGSNPFAMSSTTSAVDTSDVDSTAQSNSNSAINAAGQGNVTPADLSDGGLAGDEVRVPTGPLVSRNSSPLGPTLASLGDDPIPAVDRHEGGMLRELGLELDRDRDSEPASSESWPFQEVASIASVVMNSASDDEGRMGWADVALSGGSSIIGAAMDGGETVDLPVLAAAMAGTRRGAKHEGGPADGLVIEADGRVAAQSMTSNAESDASERSGTTAAMCGLVLIVGLSSGPILPELLPRLRARMPFAGSRRRSGRGAC